MHSTVSLDVYGFLSFFAARRPSVWSSGGLGGGRDWLGIFLGNIAHHYSHGAVLAIVMAPNFLYRLSFSISSKSPLSMYPFLAPIMIDFGYDPLWFLHTAGRQPANIVS